MILTSGAAAAMLRPVSLYTSGREWRQGRTRRCPAGDARGGKRDGDDVATLRPGPGRRRDALVPGRPDVGEGDQRPDRRRPRPDRTGAPGRVRLAMARPPRRGR